MGFESGNFSVPESAFSHEEVKTRNEMQIFLIRQYVIEKGVSPDDNPTSIAQEWVDKYDEGFRTVFNDMKAENPNIILDWEHNPDSVLEQVQARMDQLTSR